MITMDSPPDDLQDYALLVQLRKGDYSAFDQLYMRYAVEIGWRIKKLVKVDEIAEELHQEVFLKLWEHRQKISPQTSLRPYLLRIAYNVTMDFFRKTSRDKNLREQWMIHADVHTENAVEEMVAQQSNLEVQAIVQRAIEKLPPQRKRIFTYCKLEGHSYEEAAREFGVSLNTVKDHMTRAMRFLKTELTQNHLDTLMIIFFTANFY